MCDGPFAVLLGIWRLRLACVFLDLPELSAPIGLVYCPVDRQMGFPQW
jgi:hypothetical protein